MPQVRDVWTKDRRGLGLSCSQLGGHRTSGKAPLLSKDRKQGDHPSGLRLGGSPSSLGTGSTSLPESRHLLAF